MYSICIFFFFAHVFSALQGFLGVGHQSNSFPVFQWNSQFAVGGLYALHMFPGSAANFSSYKYFFRSLDSFKAAWFGCVQVSVQYSWFSSVLNNLFLYLHKIQTCQVFFYFFSGFFMAWHALVLSNGTKTKGENLVYCLCLFSPCKQLCSHVHIEF